MSDCGSCAKGIIFHAAGIGLSVEMLSHRCLLLPGMNTHSQEQALSSASRLEKRCKPASRLFGADVGGLPGPVFIPGALKDKWLLPGKSFLQDFLCGSKERRRWL